jgi:hypothetical protein
MIGYINEILNFAINIIQTMKLDRYKKIPLMAYASKNEYIEFGFALLKNVFNRSIAMLLAIK